ncbi:MAG: polysaccharide biosynthesis/export family protein [Bacteroidota bacterium]|nr:polysaccharide biosynthesis/export family protein [Bacteroidota bacterium]
MTKIIIYSFLIFFIITSCVPLRKQIIFQDLHKKNVRALYSTDTILTMPRFKYLLKPGDILEVKITSISKSEINLDRLNELGEGNSSGPNIATSGMMPMRNERSGYVIDSLGFVKIPVLGKIEVANKTIEEARTIVQNAVNKYLDNVIVNVVMLNYFIYTYGELNIQGKIQSPKEELTLIEAIILAGGFKEYANREKIKLIRKLPNNKIHIRYISMLDQDIITSNDIYLLPNDIIVVDPMRARNIRTYVLPNAAIAVSSFSLLITLLVAFNTFRNIR